jgi:hypothetical protein
VPPSSGQSFHPLTRFPGYENLDRGKFLTKYDSSIVWVLIGPELYSVLDEEGSGISKTGKCIVVSRFKKACAAIKEVDILKNQEAVGS